MIIAQPSHEWIIGHQNHFYWYTFTATVSPLRLESAKVYLFIPCTCTYCHWQAVNVYHMLRFHFIHKAACWHSHIERNTSVLIIRMIVKINYQSKPITMHQHSFCLTASLQFNFSFADTKNFFFNFSNRCNLRIMDWIMHAHWTESISHHSQHSNNISLMSSPNRWMAITKTQKFGKYTRNGDCAFITLAERTKNECESVFVSVSAHWAIMKMTNSHGHFVVSTKSL